MQEKINNMQQLLHSLIDNQQVVIYIIVNKYLASYN